MKLVSIQWLRAVAAIAVVLAHASTTLIDKDHVFFDFRYGGYGVDLFFVISGFIMFYTTGAKPLDPATFLYRRLIRIVPIYVILTSLAFAFAVFFPHATRTFTSAPIDFFKSIAFIPYVNSVTGGVAPILVQGWTLNYEMFFYVAFALTLLLRVDARVVVMTAAFGLLAASSFAAAPENLYVAAFTNSIILEFVFGLVIGYFALRLPERFNLVVLATAAIAGFALFWAAFHGLAPAENRGMPIRETLAMPRFLLVGGVSALMVSLAVWAELRGILGQARWLVAIGDASYSLYLVHGFVLAILKRVWQAVADLQQASIHATFILACVIASVALALLSHAGLEKPIQRVLRGPFCTANKRAARTEEAGLM